MDIWLDLMSLVVKEVAHYEIWRGAVPHPCKLYWWYKPLITRCTWVKRTVGCGVVGSYTTACTDRTNTWKMCRELQFIFIKFLQSTTLSFFICPDQQGSFLHRHWKSEVPECWNHLLFTARATTMRSRSIYQKHACMQPIPSWHEYRSDT